MKITVKNAGKFRMELRNGEEWVHTDAPAEYGGLGNYPSPVALLAQSLMACALTTASKGAEKVSLDATGWHAELLEVCFDEGHEKVTAIAVRFHFGQDVPEEQRKRLEAFTMRGCTVGNSLTTEKRFSFDYDV